MTVFITKTWGFSDPCWPLQFSTEGWRARARAALKVGDVVVIVGTKGPQTQPAEQGRVLGIMEPTTEVAFWQDFDLPTRAEHFDAEGEFRWPYALLAILALAIFAWAGKLIMLFPLAGAYLVIWFARRYDPALDYARHVGDLSYGVYIYGWPSAQLVMFLFGGRANWWQVLIGSLALSLALAWLSWHGIEKWALRWGRSRRRITAEPQPAPADA